MKHPILTDQHIALLTSPEQWTLRAAALLGDHPDATLSAEHAAWYRRTRQTHSQRELLIALSGTSSYAVGDSAFAITPGTMLLLDSMEPHQEGYPDFTDNCEHLWITILEESCTASLITVTSDAPGYTGRPLGLRELPDAVQELTRRAFPPDAGPRRAQRLHLHAIIASVVALVIEEAEETLPTNAEERRREMIGAVQHHIEKTAGHGDSLDSLARIAGYSPYYFARVFKACTGVTVQTYIDRCRRHEFHRLSTEGMSKKEIGYALGFASPQSFSRWLRLHRP